MSDLSILSPAPADESWRTAGHGGAPLLVIGAGPKAIALAVKAGVLRAVGFDVPEVVAVERDRTAANWRGGRGWTNGRQRLGTLPEKDLGFPYASSLWGDPSDPVIGELAQRMSAYSWAGHLLDRGLYGRWIDRGRPQPTHGEWADYLEWAAERAGLRTVTGEVRRAELSDGGWTLTVEHGPADGAQAAGAQAAGAPYGRGPEADGPYEHGSSTDGPYEHGPGERRQDGPGAAPRTSLVHGCGLVVSGPGPATGVVNADGGRVLSTADFWRLAADGLPDRVRHVTVVGAGETAGTIVRELALGLGRQVTVVTPRATVYSRGESPFENRYYSDPTGWTALTEDDRREFIRRTDRAVFSQEVQHELTLAGNVSWESGRVVGTSCPDGGQVAVELLYAGEQRTRHCDLVVDATGGDPLWFGEILGPRARTALRAALGGTVSRDRLERAIGTSLAVTGLPAPLHLPNLAALAQGPGFPNLSSLGLLSDRVLASYVPTAPDEPAQHAAARPASAPAEPGLHAAAVRPERAGRSSLPSSRPGASHS
ncbi:SidA/IucD/PvdA family monooxygenase [Streptomyces roseicoloratus]|uniref:SidA/IucD/PvdA family monooxygenase n=1 Tax=Streptomyces roseicoloratus TaxID=2508722 RepID=UPI001009E12C|nr:SidA/IucD/PvdA family monooxygenase [Streptomyces roseicoloratus]